MFDCIFSAIVLALILQLSAQSTECCTNNMMKSSRVRPFSFYLENNVRLLGFFCLAPPVLELEAVCVHAALLLCAGVRSLGECFPLLPKGVVEAVPSAWLCVSSGCEVWKITARIAAC